MTEKEKIKLRHMASGKEICHAAVQFFHAVKLLGEHTSIIKAFAIQPDMRVEVEVSWEESIWAVAQLTGPHKEGKRVVIQDGYTNISQNFTAFIQLIGSMMEKADDHAMELWWSKPGETPKPAAKVSDKKEETKVEVMVKDTVQNKVIVIDAEGQTKVLTRCPDATD